MAKILVTGGAGFIGSHVVDAYVADGHEVAVLDNLSSGQKQFLPTGVEFFEADITDRSAVAAAMNSFRPEVLNHHAAHIQVGYSVENPQFDAQNNVIGLLNVMEEARAIGTVTKVIMASTGGAMYGDKAVPFQELMIPQPLSPYGISKRAGELYLHFYYSQFTIPYVVLRYANVYGPRQNPHGESGVIAIFMERIHEGKPVVIHGTGENTRDYVYVSDVAKANTLALSYEKVGVFNIGTSLETTTNEIFHKVTAAMNVDLDENHGPARPGEQVRSALDWSLAQRELGWEPTVNLDTGIARTAESMQHS